MYLTAIFSRLAFLNRPLFLVLACAAMWLIGCAGSKPRTSLPTALPAGFPHHSAIEIQQHLQELPDTLQAFNAKADISMAIPSQSGSFTAQMHVRRADSLYMSIRVTFGIEAARTLVTPDSFFVYDRINKQLVFGPLSYAKAFLPPPFVLGNFFPNLLGMVPPDPSVKWEVEADSMRYYLRDPAHLRTYIVDPILWRVIRYEEKDAAGTIVEDRTYSDFDNVDGYFLPRRLVFRRPPDKAFASIYYRDMELNPRSQSFDLRVGRGVKPVPVYASH